MKIDGREIGEGHPPYIIAEISGNHCGDGQKALDLIEAAKHAGADAVKFQYYTPDTITLDCDNPDFIIKDGPWKGRRLYELYKTTYTPPDWIPTLFTCARTLGITPFASVFDMSGVDALEKLDCPAYKIASMEITDTPLIRYAAKTGKPMIISTGMASKEEISAAYWALDTKEACDAGFVFLSCVSGYPTSVEESNLSERRERIGENTDYSEWGISDHTLGWEIPLAATVMRAAIIEKHLCLSRDDPTEDANFSLEPGEFQAMVAAVKRIWQAMQPSEAKSEESSRQLRRSLYVTQDMQRGDMFTIENVRSIRPGYGLPPSHLDKVICRRANQDIKRGTALTESLIK